MREAQRRWPARATLPELAEARRVLEEVGEGADCGDLAALHEHDLVEAIEQMEAVD